MQQKKIFATLFSTVAIITILGAEAAPMVAEHGTRQLSEAQLLGLLYSNPSDERLVASGWEHWRYGGLGQVRFLTEIGDDFRRFVDEIWRF